MVLLEHATSLQSLNQILVASPSNTIATHYDGQRKRKRRKKGKRTKTNTSNKRLAGYSIDVAIQQGQKSTTLTFSV